MKIDHDALFKQILNELFPQFMELFYPDIAKRLDFTTLEKLDKETFSDFAKGVRRYPDFLARVKTHDGKEEIILVHIEVQRKRLQTVRRRMFEYYMLLRLNLRLPVFPIVLYLAPGAGGITQETYTESLFGKERIRFEYEAISLPDLPVEAYWEQESLLGVALSALMSSKSLSVYERKHRAFLRLLRSNLNEAVKHLLIYTVDAYLPLSDRDAEALESELRHEIGEEVNEMEMWTMWHRLGEKRGLELGEQRGLELGEKRGLELGKEEGHVLGAREVLLRILRAKFGELPAETETTIKNMNNVEALEELAIQTLTAQSLAELNFAN